MSWYANVWPRRPARYFRTVCSIVDIVPVELNVATNKFTVYLPDTFLDYSDKIRLDRYSVTVTVLGLPVLVRK